jgi:hypothetical protein
MMDDIIVYVVKEGWNQMSIWFTLEYWRHLKICYLLDPMHIFGNIGHLLWKHLIGVKDTSVSLASLVDVFFIGYFVTCHWWLLDTSNPWHYISTRFIDQVDFFKGNTSKWNTTTQKGSYWACVFNGNINPNIIFLIFKYIF